MKDLFNYIASKPYVGVIIAVLIIAAVFMWIKAVSASQKSREEREAIIAKLEKEKALREEFKTIDGSKFETDDNERLLCGIAANIQMFLEKQTDMNAAFEALPEEKKSIYALNYVFEDAKEDKLSQFFTANGQPLTGKAQKAVESIIGGRFSEVFASAYKMTDGDCEDVSFDAAKIEEYNKEYSDIMKTEKTDIFDRIGSYIKSNKDIFIG